MNCLSEEQLEQAASKAKWAWRQHLKDCPTCKGRLEEIRLNLALADEFKSLLTEDKDESGSEDGG